MGSRVIQSRLTQNTKPSGLAVAINMLGMPVLDPPPPARNGARSGRLCAGGTWKCDCWVAVRNLLQITIIRIYIYVYTYGFGTMVPEVKFLHSSQGPRAMCTLLACVSQTSVEL